MNTTKQSWEIDILYSLVRKTKFDLILHVWPIPKNYCYFAVEKISNDDALFEGAICNDCSLTLYSNI